MKKRSRVILALIIVLLVAAGAALLVKNKKAHCPEAYLNTLQNNE